MSGVEDAREAVATAAGWAGVRELDIAAALSDGDVLRAKILDRSTAVVSVVAAVVLHLVLVSPGPPTLDPRTLHLTVVVLMGMLAPMSLVALVALLLGHRGMPGSLPPPPAGDLDHAALEALLNRDNVFRARRAGGVGMAGFAAVIAHVVLLRAHVPTTARADLAPLAVLGLVGLYAIFAAPGRDRLARDVADDVARLVAKAGV